MQNYISIIIPNRNGSATIGKCLEAAYSSNYENFEVIVVDDCSEDNSVEIIKRFPCRLIRLEKHSGASKARNTGAFNSNGKILFFTDADCLLNKNALMIANNTVNEKGSNVIIGGTYTKIPHDERFFSIFQSIFINYSETKNIQSPDYIATHAMIIDSEVFRKSGGFSEDFLPIIEDVEFSHRLRRAGYKLLMNPEILARHIFNFDMKKSLRNSIKKSLYWTMYSLKNRDFLADSGTASVELKVNVISCFLTILTVLAWIMSKNSVLMLLIPLIFLLNIFVSRDLLKIFFDTKGIIFGISALAYYTVVYSFSVGIGAFSGIVAYLSSRGRSA